MRQQRQKNLHFHLSLCLSLSLQRVILSHPSIPFPYALQFYLGDQTIPGHTSTSSSSSPLPRPAKPSLHDAKTTIQWSTFSHDTSDSKRRRVFSSKSFLILVPWWIFWFCFYWQCLPECVAWLVKLIRGCAWFRLPFLHFFYFLRYFFLHLLILLFIYLFLCVFT